jgi:H+/gluconate symporter-like permease
MASCFSLTDFKNTGITDRIRKQFSPIMEDRKDVPHTSVTLDMVMNIYVVWAVGVLVSVLILGFERLFHKQRLRKKLNSNVSVL